MIYLIFCQCFLVPIPSKTIQVAGKYNPVYEAYYKQVDPKGTGAIEALAAAKFLKKSGLSDVVLSRVSNKTDYFYYRCILVLGRYFLSYIFLVQI